eukprot:gene4101-5077_t
MTAMVENFVSHGSYQISQILGGAQYFFTQYQRGRNQIYDGGNDMYDGGNQLNIRSTSGQTTTYDKASDEGIRSCHAQNNHL